jgi:hypothetical protein
MTYDTRDTDVMFAVVNIYIGTKHEFGEDRGSTSIKREDRSSTSMKHRNSSLIRASLNVGRSSCRERVCVWAILPDASHEQHVVLGRGGTNIEVVPGA